MEKELKSFDSVEKPSKVDGRKFNGGKRKNAGRKVNVELAKEIAFKEGYDVAKSEFWVKLANEKAVAVLIANMDMTFGDMAVKSALAVLDRALGRPKEKHEVTGEGGGPLKITWEK